MREGTKKFVYQVCNKQEQLGQTDITNVKGLSSKGLLKGHSFAPFPFYATFVGRINCGGNSIYLIQLGNPWPYIIFVICAPRTRFVGYFLLHTKARKSRQNSINHNKMAHIVNLSHGPKFGKRSSLSLIHTPKLLHMTSSFVMCSMNDCHVK